MTGESANVRSLEALRTIRAGLLKFDEDVNSAFSMLDTEIHRTMEWLEHDRPQHWRLQIQRGFDQVAEARRNLESCHMREVAGNRPACIEEKVALRKAKERLQTAQEKIEVVRRWSVKVGQEFDEYRGRIGHLQTFLEGDVPRCVALLERMLQALEGYTDYGAPAEDLLAGAATPSEDTPDVSDKD